MLVSFPSPVLSVAADVVKDLDGGEALSGLWHIFTKCKESLQEGERLENISWRLWYREVSQYRSSLPSSRSLSPEPFDHSVNGVETPLSPISQQDEARYDGPYLTSTSTKRVPSPSSPNGRAGASLSEIDHRLSVSPASSYRPSSIRSKSSSSVGRIIVDMLPDNKLVGPNHQPRHACDASSIPPRPDSTCVVVSPLPGMLPSHHSQSPHAPSTPPSGSNSISTSTLFPRVVVVNPTPHPTPPATPAPPSPSTHFNPHSNPIHPPKGSPPTLRHPQPQSQAQAHLLPPPRVSNSVRPAPTLAHTPLYPSHSTRSSHPSHPSQPSYPPSGSGSASGLDLNSSSSASSASATKSTTSHSHSQFSPSTAPSGSKPSGASNGTAGPSPRSISSDQRGPTCTLGPSPELGIGTGSGTTSFPTPVSPNAPALGSSSSNPAPPSNPSLPLANPQPPLIPVPSPNRSAQAVSRANGLLSSSKPSGFAPPPPPPLPLSLSLKAKPRVVGSIERGTGTGLGVIEAGGRSVIEDTTATANATLRPADRRFFLQQAESPSPERASLGGTSVTTTTTDRTGMTGSTGRSEREREREREAEREREREMDIENEKQRRLELEREKERERGREREKEREREEQDRRRTSHPEPEPLPLAPQQSTLPSSARQSQSQSQPKSPLHPETQPQPQPSSVNSNVTRGSINSSSRRPQRSHTTGVGTKRGKDSAVGAVRHAPTRPPMHRFVTARHGQHPLVQRKAAGGGESKGRATFNVGSVGSSASRKTESTSPPERGEESKEKMKSVNSTTSNSPAPLPPLQPAPPVQTNALPPPLTKTTSAPERGSPKATTGLTAAETDARAMPPPPIPPSRATQAKPPPPPTAPASSTRLPNPQQQRRGIVVTHSSDEYETTDDDSEDDSGSWASEDMSADETTHPTNNKRTNGNLNNSKKTTAQKLEEAQVRERLLQVEREREMFAKQPKRSYSNLNRTHSGFLSALLNPDPSLFPENHPVRVMSSHDMSSASGLGRMMMTMGQGQGQSQAGPSRPSMAMPTLSTSKSAVALPVAAQVTAQAPKTNGVGTSPNNDRHNANAGKGRYQPKGRPQDQEMDSDSETDAESPSNLSRSHAHEKLAALAADNNFRRRHSDRPTPSTSKPPHPSDPPMATRPTLPSVATAPIPLNHPWNLPTTAAAPSTPRTTRRQMMSTEISESVRRNLLWERQVNKPQVGGLTKRSMSTAGGMMGMTGQALGSGLRPLTSTTSQPGQKREGQGQQGLGQDKGKARENGDAAGGMDEQTEKEYNERKKKAMARNRSWADDYHYSGW